MEVRWQILLMIIGASAVTWLPRVLPLAVLSRITLPDWAMRWLRHVPVAVMAALVGQELFLSGGKLGAHGDLAAALLAFAAAVLTRSLLATVLVGVAAAMVLRNFIG